MSGRWLFLLLSLTLNSTLFPSTLCAQGRGHDRGNGVEDRDDDDRRRVATIVFSARDRDVISRYFRGRYSNLPPGLAKRGGNLPPGLQKHLERDGTLPPGLQKRLTPFPADLERRLPRLPDVYRRGSIGDSVVIIDRRTQRVMDVIYDILRP